MSRPSRHRSAVVIGAGAGLGRSLALGLAAKGYIVFGTANSADEVQDLKKISGGRVGLAVCQLTKGDRIRTWAAGVSDALDGAGLNILFTNIGRSAIGPLEFLPIEDIRREFETNVFGAITTIGAFVPVLRRGRGRVVQISDWTTAIPMPFDGPFAASKAATEAITAVYRAELQPFVIDVILALGGSETLMRATATANKLIQRREAMTCSHPKLYGKRFKAFKTELAKLQDNEADMVAAVSRLIMLAEQQPAPICATITEGAGEVLREIQGTSDPKARRLRSRLFGFA